MKPNMISKTTRWLSGIAAAFLFFLNAPAAVSEDLPQMTGEQWEDSSPAVKRAYLIGISNLMDAEYAFQMRFAKPKPSSKQTLIQRMYGAADGNTIDASVAAVDAWYAKNADKKNKAILDVLWLIYVKKDS